MSVVSINSAILTGVWCLTPNKSIILYKFISINFVSGHLVL